MRATDEGQIAGRSGEIGGHFDMASRRFFQRTADRYWLLQYENEELRFTHRSDAQRWASELSERRIAWQLTWHDENTPARQTEMVPAHQG